MSVGQHGILVNKVLYSARKKIAGNSERTSVTQYAMAFRSGVGRVALLQTTFPKCGPGKYAFLTKSGRDDSAKTEFKRKNDNPCYMQFYREFEEKYIQRLTMGQSTPEWFLLWKFCFTGTTAEIAWKAACEDEAIHYFVKEVLQYLFFSFDFGKVVQNYDLHIIRKSFFMFN
jgi:hypothetical protein